MKRLVLLLILFFETPFFSFGMELPDGWNSNIDNGCCYALISDPICAKVFGVNHASTAAIRFKGTNPANRAIQYTTYVSTFNYVAKEASFRNKNFSKQNPSWTPSIIEGSQRSNELPLPHSEIAFLQDITENVDPANSIRSGFLGRLLAKHNGESVYIFIKNSCMLPCYSGSWGKGIYCDKYLRTFCNNVKAVYGNCAINVRVVSDGREQSF